MFKRKILTPAAAAMTVAVFLAVMLLSLVQAHFDGALIPSEDSVMTDQPCFASNCHAAPGSTFNQVGEVTVTGLPEAWEPGETYSLEVTATEGVVFGMQAAIVDGNDNQAGILTSQTNGLIKQVQDGVEILVHSPEPLDDGVFAFDWTAPENLQGPVTLRLATNSADGNVLPTNDHINFRTFVIPQAEVDDPDVEERILYFPQMAEGQEGMVGFRTTLIIVNAGEATTVDLDFFNSAGDPLVVDLGGLGTDSSFSLPLERGESLSARTPGTTEGFQVGYARMTGSPEVGGTLIITRVDAPSGLILSQAGVAATEPFTEATLFVDTLEEKDTGVAMVNAGEEAATVTLRLYDTDFALLDTEDVQLAPGEHLASFVFERFPTTVTQMTEMQGTLTVSSTEPLALLTLRTRDDPAFVFPERVPILTTFPVVPGRVLPEGAPSNGGNGDPGSAPDDY